LQLNVGQSPLCIQSVDYILLSLITDWLSTKCLSFTYRGCSDLYVTHTMHLHILQKLLWFDKWYQSLNGSIMYNCHKWQDISVLRMLLIIRLLQPVHAFMYKRYSSSNIKCYEIMNYVNVIPHLESYEMWQTRYVLNKFV
jgi:hypothetical protein